MEKVAFIGMDIHATHSVIGWMDEHGRYRDQRRIVSSESALIRAIVRIKARRKILTFEEGSIAGWVARTVREYVDELIVCDPRENHAISKSIHKGDGADTYQLCRLLRLGELKKVYQAQEDHRAHFKEAASEYLKLRERQKSIKQRIKDKLRRWGVQDLEGQLVYHERGRKAFLAKLRERPVRRQLERLYGLMDVAVAAHEDAWRDLQQLGRRYDEIGEFQKVPGMGPKGSHIFDAFIQTPHRFPNRSKIWRYCRLAIVKPTSNRKKIAYERLDQAGHGELKAIFYRAVKAARARRDENEVKIFYEASLAATHDPVHARLNTQRKIITTLYSIWKRGVAYQPELFLKNSPYRRVAT